MSKTRGGKWNRRFCKWIASLLTTVLLVNQIGFTVLAEENTGEVCLCFTRCTVDSVHGGCPVCAEDYGKCEGVEVGSGAGIDEELGDIGADVGTGEEQEVPGAVDDVNADTETVQDTDADEEAENSAAGTDTAMDEGKGESDESGGGTDTDVDAVSDVGTDGAGEYAAEAQAGETKNVNGQDAVGAERSSDEFIYDGLTYKIINQYDPDDLRVEVPYHAGGFSSSISGDLVIPAKVSNGMKEYDVVRIGSDAFWGNENLTSVTILGNVTSIGETAFCYCSNLESITIPDSVTSIEKQAFDGCSSLKNLILPDKITNIGESAFVDCSSLENITIPDSITKIEGGVFTGCSGLKNITIPDSVTSIGMHAFSGCSSLGSITIPEKVTNIERYTFTGCSSLENITIPGNVIEIGYGAFQNCSSLKSITIPSNVRSMQIEAFAGCSALTSATILNDTLAFSGRVFGNCEKLSDLRIALTENFYASGYESEDDFEGCPQERYLTFLTEDGQKELDDTTIPALAKAVKDYDAADGNEDEMWYGWKLSKTPAVTNYSVEITANKDRIKWSNCPKKFALSDDGVTFSHDFDNVSNGKYIIYETEAEDGTGYVSTGITVEVKDADTKATINYYTVTFYNDDENTEDNVFDEQIVRENVEVNRPDNDPTRDGYSFVKWVSEDGTEFIFGNPPTAKTDIYAKWIKDEEETPPATEYSVTINVRKDGIAWSGSGKTFVLSSDKGVNFITDLSKVPDGTYDIYDTMGASTSTGYVKTGVEVVVKGASKEETVEYYTVTLYDGDTLLEEKIVPKNSKVSKPSPDPKKDGYTFYRWVTSKDGSTEFDFGNQITARTNIFASWIGAEEETFTIKASAGRGGSVSPSGDVKVKTGADQQFTITPEKGYRITSVLVDGSEVLSSGKTGERSKAGRAGISDAENSIKYYTFENVTEDHTLAARFEAVVVTGYSVTIKVKKDGSAWSGSGKTFALSSDHSTFITDYTAVPNGTYTIYDITGAADSTGYVNTDVIVEVKDAPAQAEVNYYTVTFYNDDTRFREQVVLENLKVSAPTVSPAKDGYTFYRWVTSKDGSTEFNFGNPITTKTDIYASWIRAVEETFTIKASAGSGGSVSPSGEVKVKAGDNQRFTITPEKGYQIASILVDGNEVISGGQTGKQSKAGISNGENNIKYYTFENVTSDHALAASFKAINTGNKKPIVTSGGGKGSGSSGGDNTSGSNSTADSGSSITVVLSDMNVRNDAGNINSDSTAPASSEKEPKTGDASHTEIYATIAMISGVSYIALYFADGKRGMTEEEKKEIIAALVRWAKKGKRVRRYVALAVIFLVLVYYHSIGKRTLVNWKAIYVK